MAKATTAKKVIVLVDANISTAWANLCSEGTKAEATIVTNIELLQKAIAGSKLSVQDAQELIRASKKESAFLSVSQVEALGVWAIMRKNNKDFRALKLAKQLSTASATFSLLGVESAKSMGETASLDTILGENKKARKVKSDKAKAKAREASATSGKKVASLPSTLADILAFFTATDMSIYTEKQLDIVAEIHATIESKVSLVDA
jgi:hypothetical protein